MVSEVDLRDDDVERPILSLSPLAVAPDVHGQGIGSALVLDVAARVDADGHPLIVLEGSPVYYARFGFTDAREHGIRIDLPDWAPPEAGQVLRLAHDDPSITRRRRVPAGVRRPAALSAVARLSGSRRARRGPTRRRRRRPAPGRGRRAW